MFSDAGVDMRPGPRRPIGPMRPRPMSHEAGVQPMQPPMRPPMRPMRPMGPLPGHPMDARPPRPESDQMNERPPMPNVFQSRPEPGSLNMPNRIAPSDNPYVHNFVPGAGAPPPMDYHETETNMQGMGFIAPMGAPIPAITYHTPRPIVPGIPIAPGMRIPVPHSVDASHAAADLNAKHNEATEMLLRIQEKVGAGHTLTPQEHHFVQVMARPMLALR